MPDHVDITTLSVKIISTNNRKPQNKRALHRKTSDQQRPLKKYLKIIKSNHQLPQFY